MIGSLTAELYPRQITCDSELEDQVLNLLHSSPPAKALLVTNALKSCAFQMHLAGKIADAALTTLALLHAVQSRHRNLWLVGTENGYSPGRELLGQISRVRLRGVKPQATLALELWSKQKIRARTCCGEVTVAELVTAQASGFRYVGLSNDPDFVAHDLCHLFRYFFADMDSLEVSDYHETQRGFFVLVRSILGELQSRGWISGASYDQAPLNRIVTDMNGEGFFLHSAMVAQLILLLREQGANARDLRPTALRLLWGDLLPPSSLGQMVDPAQSAPVIWALRSLV